MYRIDKLLKQDRKLFHTADLSVIWGITNKNTLYKLISRYLQKQVLFPVYKGLYSTVDPNGIDPILLGATAINTYCYLSTESVLYSSGVISQKVYPYTFVSSVSKRFVVSGVEYISRMMKPEFLLNTSGIEQKGDVFVASTERAVADMLYYNPKYYFDKPDLVDWKGVKKIQKEVGYDRG